MVFARGWAQSRPLAGYQGCRRGAGDYGGPTAGQTESYGPRPARGPRAHRAGIVARPRTHEPDARSTPRDLVGALHSGHALVRRRLERGHQWRFPHRRLTLTGAAAGDLPASDHRRAAVSVVETGGA